MNSLVCTLYDIYLKIKKKQKNKNFDLFGFLFKKTNKTKNLKKTFAALHQIHMPQG